MLLGIPIKQKIDLQNKDYIINMNDLEFNFDKDKQKLAAFIYLRNSGIKNKLDFSKCLYKDKEEFLLLYLQKNIFIIDEILANTWAKILNNDKTVEITSILNDDEIKLFREKNKEFIFTIKEFINSLILYKVSEMDKDFFKMDIKSDNIKHTDIDNISVVNLYKVLKNHPYLFILIEPTEIFYYDKIFIKEYKSILLSIINISTPFNGLLSMIFNTLKLGEKNGINN